MKNIYKSMIIIVLIILFSSITVSWALTDEENRIIEEKHDFYTDEFIFEFNDPNTSIYDGDSGLKGAYAKNGEDRLTYYLPVECVRSIAYITKGTFELSEHIDVKHSLLVDNRSYDCIMLDMYKKDGSEIPKLDVKDSHLTNEQKSYFDDYESERADYLQQQEEYALEDIEDSYSRSSSHKDKHSRYSYYYSSRGGYGVAYHP